MCYGGEKESGRKGASPVGMMVNCQMSVFGKGAIKPKFDKPVAPKLKNLKKLSFELTISEVEEAEENQEESLLTKGTLSFSLWVDNLKKF